MERLRAKSQINQKQSDRYFVQMKFCCSFEQSPNIFECMDGNNKPPFVLLVEMIAKKLALRIRGLLTICTYGLPLYLLVINSMHSCLWRIASMYRFFSYR